MAEIQTSSTGVSGGVNSETLLLRQINPEWVKHDRVTSQAFTPTPKDKNRLSAYDGDQTTPRKSWIHFTTNLGNQSIGVMAVTVRECEKNDTSAFSDPAPFPEHVLIDFSRLTRSKAKRVGKVLTSLARRRGWLHRAKLPSSAP